MRGMRRARGDVAIAAISRRGRTRAREGRVSRELRRQLVAGQDFDGVLHARVVGKDVVAARTVAEKADDARVSAVENADDAAFGALRAVTGAGAQNFGEDVVAVHGVLDGSRAG